MTRPTSEAIEVAETVIEQLACEIDPRYLVECKWMVKARNDTKRENLRVTNHNAQLYTECYVLHNKFVKQYKNEITE